MRHRVYRSLDQSPALFGIEGSYLVVFLAGLGLSLVLALLVGSVASSLVSFGLFFLGAAFSYFGVQFLQTKFSEKELKRYVSCFSMPRFIRVPPARMSLDADEYFEGPVE